MMFTLEELEQYNIRQLRNLALYFSIEFDTKSSKGQLIEKIYTYLEKEKSSENAPPSSVRIRRIRESQKER